MVVLNATCYDGVSLMLLGALGGGFQLAALTARAAAWKVVLLSQLRRAALKGSCPQ